MAGIEIVDTKQKISAFDISSRDNPRDVISHPLFNGTNYDEWARNFRMAISSRKKFGFLNGAITKPSEDSPDYEDWVANNHLIVGWIKLTMEPAFRSSISNREVARDVWEIIKKRFCVKGSARLQQIRSALSSCKQNGSSVGAYFGRLMLLWDTLDECSDTKKCSCGHCTCNLNEAHQRESEIMRTHDFMAGLDDVHTATVSQICGMNPIPDMESVYQTIVQNETRIKEAEFMSFGSQLHMGSVHPSTMLGAAPGGRVNRDPTRWCTVCGRTGHEAVGCFKIVGYPDWWKDGSKSNKWVKNAGGGKPQQEYEMRKKKQDEGLDVIPEGFDVLKNLRRDMNEDEMETKVDGATLDLKNTNVQLKQQLVQMRSSRNFCITVLLCVIVGIVSYIYK